MKIAVLAGGFSTERFVSFSSGTLIANALRECGNDVMLIDSYLGLESPEKINFTKEPDEPFVLDGTEPDLEGLRREHPVEGDIGPNVIEACKMADAVFIALHGGIGENGALQKVLEAQGIPFTGSSSAACEIAMNKIEAKKLLSQNGVPTPDWALAENGRGGLDSFSVPCVVKPNDGGSSIGVSIVFDKEKLGDAIREAGRSSGTVFVEKYIKGREFSVGVLCGMALPPIEIIAGEGFYDYKNKYIAGLTKEVCPCDLDSEKQREAMELGRKAHDVLSLGSYSRTDMILSEEDGKFYVLEVNALPGMTPVSLLPKEAAAVGTEYKEICRMLVDAAVKKDTKMDEMLTDSALSEAVEEAPQPDEKIEVIGIKFRENGKIYYFDPGEISFTEKEKAIVETSRGTEYGEVIVANTFVSSSEIVPPLRPVIRRATEADTAHYLDNLSREKDIFNICLEKIEKHGLEMKLIDTEYTFDNSKLLFYFTADGRIDFRELVKDLATTFKTRIELRQIGIRDEAKMMGGLGICGRTFCCHSFLPNFAQVSIKMAKAQNLSLNGAKISGACGRLMCCLRYEYDFYNEELKVLPPVDSIVSTPEGEGVVCEIQPILGIVKVRLSSSSDAVAKPYKKEDVTLISLPKKKKAPEENASDELDAVIEE